MHSLDLDMVLTVTPSVNGSPEDTPVVNIKRRHPDILTNFSATSTKRLKTIFIHFYDTCFSGTVDPSVLEELRKEEINKEKLTSTITNIITYSIYIFLLIALATTMNGRNTYYQKEQVERLINVSSDDNLSVC